MISRGGPISEKHLIEYAQIDNDLFRNKYKHSNWIDRRSIIQLNSKDAEKLNKTILYTGHEGKVDPKFDRILWTTKAPFSARLYADSDDNVLQIVIPKEAKIKTTDADESHWAQLNNISGRKTNHFVAEAFHDGYDIAEIKNVIDVGPNYVPKDSKFYIDLPDFLVQDDIVIKRGFPRKSIIGNNGDFDLSDPNLFKKQGGKLKLQFGNKMTPEHARLLGRRGMPGDKEALAAAGYDSKGRPLLTFGGGSFGGGGAGATFGDGIEQVENYDYVRNTPILQSFSDAFNNARKSGLSSFTFNGKEYTTEMSDNPNYVGKKYQPLLNIREVLDKNMKVMSDSTRVEPYLGQIPGTHRRKSSQ